MSIQFGDILKHNNLVYPIVDINDVKGGLRSIATFSSPALVSEFTSIPEKYRSGYSLLLETSTGTIYYLAGLDATNVSHWSPVGVGGNGTGIPFTIPKWTSSSILGNSNITDNGDTVTINGNLMVIGTTSTISSENLLVKDPIILLAGSQSGVPTYDAGLFVNRGSSDTQAFIWDESETEFKFITTTSGATVSGDVTIGTYSSVRTGVLSVGTGSRVNSRFIVSSSGGTVSLVVDEFGNVYNRGTGNISSNTAFGAGALLVNTSGYDNTAIGVNTLLLNTTGHANTAIGAQSLYSNSGNRNTAVGNFSLYSNTSGVDNVAVGNTSLYLNTTGSQNTAIGAQSLYLNKIGSDNTVLGFNSLFSNRAGNYNTAIGNYSLYSNTSGAFLSVFFTAGTGYVDGTYSNVELVYATGSNSFVDAPVVDIGISSGEVQYVNTIDPGTGFTELGTIFTINSYGTHSAGSGFEIVVNGFESGNNNTAIGYTSLYNNTTGDNNIAIGNNSLYYNRTGQDNTSIGVISLLNNTTGQYNTSIGNASLYNNTTGQDNIAIGYQSLYSNTIGNYNTTIGNQSLSNNKGDENTAIGWWSLIANTTGQYNTAIGSGSLGNNTTGSYNIAIGKQAGIYRVGGFVSATNSNNSIFIGYNTTSGATTSNNTNEIVIGHATVGNGSNTVTLGNNSVTKTYLKGTVYVGTGLVNSDDRFVVSSSGGTVSLIVDQNGYVYNRGRGGTATNTAFGLMTLGANTTGNRNTAFGASALSVNTTGQTNTAIGHQSLNQNISGSNNTAIGTDSLKYNRNSSNTAIGYQSLSVNTIGISNTAVGSNALLSNTSVINTFVVINPGSGYLPGTYNNVQLSYATGSAAISYPKANIIVDGTGQVTSVTPGNNLGSGFIDTTTRMTTSSIGGGTGFEVGVSPLSSPPGLLTGNYNTAVGQGSLLSNTSGSFNTAVGQGSLDSNSTGGDNTAIGAGSLQSNSTGNYNTAVGKYSMFFNTTGDSNTGIGWQALPNNTTGYQNTATGRNSLFNNRTGVWNTAVGDGALYLSTLGNFNTAVGLDAAGQGSTTGVSVLGTFSSGNGYTPGTYSGVQLNYSSGSQILGVLPEYYPFATIVVGTGGTISSVTLETSGKTFGTSSTTIMGATIYPLSIVDGGPGYTASSTFSNIPLSYISGGTATTYPVVTVYTGPGGTVSSVTIVTNGSGFQDNTTIMGANLGTGTFSVKAAPNSIGPGTGFTVRVASLQTAQSNTVVGFKSLYYNTIGSNNVSFGHEAGNYTNTAPYFNYISDNSVYIGYLARAKNSNETNQIVIGHEAYGNGSNTVTLGNDLITKTYLKGKVQLPTIPTNSGTYSGTYSTYHILTRNDTTGEVEKVRPNVDEIDAGTLTITLTYLTTTYPNATTGFKIYQHRPGFPTLIFEKTASIWIQYQANSTF